VGAPSFTFTVACSGDNSPLRKQQTDPNTVRISNDNLRVLRRFASRESNRSNEASDGFSPTGMCKLAGAYTSSGKNCGDTNLSFFTVTFHWNSIKSSWVLAASTPVVSSCWSSAPPPSSVNDGSLPTNISDDAQQSSGTYKIFTKSLIHTRLCVFCFIWNVGNVCY